MLIKYSKFAKYINWLAVPGWVYGGTMAGFAITVYIVKFIKNHGVSFAGVNVNVLQLVLQALAYVVVLLIVIGTPYLLVRKKITWKLLGLNKKPKWNYILIVIGAFGIYYFISILFMLAVAAVNPEFNISEKQEIGFQGLSNSLDYIVAFLALVVIAPVVEEVIFRGFMFGVLKKSYSFWFSAILVSLVFGLAHGSWNVGVDTFALSLVLCYLRNSYDSLYPAIFLHMTKNGLAYFMLFIVQPF